LFLHFARHVSRVALFSSILGNFFFRKNQPPQKEFRRALQQGFGAHGLLLTRSLSCVWHGRGGALICFWIWPVMRCVWHCFLSSLVVFSFKKSGTANRDPSYTPAGIWCMRLSLVSWSSELKVRLEAAGYDSTADGALNWMRHRSPTLHWILMGH
jgi:hypothetical protein